LVFYIILRCFGEREEMGSREKLSRMGKTVAEMRRARSIFEAEEVDRERERERGDSDRANDADDE
jgi:hypothetical protein